MSNVRMPRSLRSIGVAEIINGTLDGNSTRKVTVGCLIAVASITGAEAQQAPLAPVTVDAPVVRKKPAATKPSAEQLRVRNAVRRAARAKQAAQAAAAAANAALAPDRDPYADPAAPYKGDRLASPKFPEPIVNTPRSITVITRDVIQDKDATSLKDLARTTPGVTLGTGEGGNAFGDRFFIRGFDARNDVFVDGIRDPAVNIRENFFTEQVEILKGPCRDHRRPRHHRRRAQHRHQAGDRQELLQRRYDNRQRRHQARDLRRQSGHQSDARRPHGRHVAECQCCRAQIHHR